MNVRAAVTWLVLCVTAVPVAARGVFEAGGFDCTLGESPGTRVRIAGLDPAHDRAAVAEDTLAARDSQVIRTESGITLVTPGAGGSLVFTTIFAGPAESSGYDAVQSRHLTAMTGIPQLGQRVGSCRALP